MGTVVQVLEQHSVYEITVLKSGKTNEKSEVVLACSEFVVSVTCRSRRTCNRCLEFLVNWLNRWSSASPQIDLSVGLEAPRYPRRTERLRKASRRALSSALAKPHQTGEAYDSRVMTVARSTCLRASVGRTCGLSVRMANSDCAHAANI